MRHVIIFIFLVFAKSISAQDPIFTQAFTVPETLNTGFTGAIEGTKAGMIHRTQWPGIDFSINTQFAFVDTWFDDFNSGVGISILNHKETKSRYTFTQLNLNYAIAFQLSDAWYFRPSISLGIGSKDYGFQNLLLEDQINIYNGIVNTSSIDPVLLNEQNLFFDFSTSLLLNNEHSWIGVTFRHLNKPNISMTHRGQTPLGIFLSVHGTIEIPLSYFSISNQNSIYFFSNFMKQDEYARFDFGSQYVFDNFSVGVSIATNPIKNEYNSSLMTSVSPFIGFKWDGWKFNYSYGINTSEIGPTGGVYELSITYEFSGAGFGGNGRRGKRLKCPTFF
ncbi:MAG: PorP/SprF family type IX secretion system membrane protein [Polaribacter sp.]|nr:PorP/SprF family type IX secretion system membrane protein [Polaribacter sp.]